MRTAGCCTCRGDPRALERAFGVTLAQYQFADGRGPFVGVGRAPTLAPEAIAVLGLDRGLLAGERRCSVHAAPFAAEERSAARA